MKFLLQIITILSIILSCTGRDGNIGSQNNPYDPSGDNWTENQAPVIIDSAFLSRPLWQNFNSLASTGNVILNFSILDYDGIYDTVTSLFTISTDSINYNSIGVDSLDNGFLIQNLALNTTYYLKVTAYDKHQGSDTLILSFITPIATPPAPPYNFTTVANNDYITLTSYCSDTSDTIVFLKSLFLDKNYVIIDTMINHGGTAISYDYNSDYSMYYYLTGTINSYGISILADTLSAKQFNSSLSVPSYPQGDGNEYNDSIRISFYVNYIYSPDKILKYEIYRSQKSDGAYVKIGEMPVVTQNTNYFTDRNVKKSESYYYKVSYNTELNGASSLSKESSALHTLQIDPPSSVNASKGTYGDSVYVSWSKYILATSYVVYRSFNADTTVLDTTSELNYTDFPPTDTTYYYNVASIDSNGNVGSRSADQIYGNRLKYAKSFIIDTNDITDSTINLIWSYDNSNYNNKSVSIISRSDSPTFSSANTDTVRNNNMYSITFKDTAVNSNYIPYYYKVIQLDTVSNLTSAITLVGPITPAPKPIYNDSISVESFPDSTTFVWPIQESAIGYKIYRSKSYSSSKSYFELYKNVLDTTITITDSLSTTFYYKITSYNESAESHWTFEYGIPVIALTPPDSGTVYSESNAAHIQISWSKFARAKKYYIYRSVDDSLSFAIFDTADTNLFKDTVLNSSTYYYKIKAWNKAGVSGFSNIVSGKRVVPSTPANISATDGTLTELNKIEISWMAPIGAESFRIQRALDASFKLDTTIIIDSLQDTVFVDSTVTTDTLYYYRVLARNPLGASIYSSYTTGFRRPVTVPDTLKLSSVTGYVNYIRINWQNHSSTSTNYNGFKIYSSKKVDDLDSAVNLIGTVTNTSQTYFDDNSNENFQAIDGKSTWYKVKAFNAVGEGECDTILPGARTN